MWFSNVVLPDERFMWFRRPGKHFCVCVCACVVLCPCVCRLTHRRAFVLAHCVEATAVREENMWVTAVAVDEFPRGGDEGAARDWHAS